MRAAFGVMGLREARGFGKCGDPLPQRSRRRTGADSSTAELPAGACGTLLTRSKTSRHKSGKRECLMLAQLRLSTQAKRKQFEALKRSFGQHEMALQNGRGKAVAQIEAAWQSGNFSALVANSQPSGPGIGGFGTDLEVVALIGR